MGNQYRTTQDLEERRHSSTSTSSRSEEHRPNRHVSSSTSRRAHNSRGDRRCNFYRATIDLDNNDIELCRSAFVTAEYPVFPMGEQGFNIDQSIALVGSMTPTHYTTNIRIDVKEDADSAVLTAYALNQHDNAGTGNVPGTAEHLPTGNPNKSLLASGQYVVHMEKDAKDGVWKTRKWVYYILWTRGDFAGMSR